LRVGGGGVGEKGWGGGGIWAGGRISEGRGEMVDVEASIKKINKR